MHIDYRLFVLTESDAVIPILSAGQHTDGRGNRSVIDTARTSGLSKFRESFAGTAGRIRPRQRDSARLPNSQ
jgi:hypothetical protein